MSHGGIHGYPSIHGTSGGGGPLGHHSPAFGTGSERINGYRISGFSSQGIITTFGCQPKNRGGFWAPKMDGENNGKPYEQMDDLGGNTPIFGNTHL